MLANVRTGGRLVSLWRGRFMLDPATDGIETGAKVVVNGDPTFEIAVSGPVFEDGYASTATRALSAVRPLALLPPGLHTVDELAPRPAWW